MRLDRLRCLTLDYIEHCNKAMKHIDFYAGLDLYRLKYYDRYELSWVNKPFYDAADLPL